MKTIFNHETGLLKCFSAQSTQVSTLSREWMLEMVAAKAPNPCKYTTNGILTPTTIDHTAHHFMNSV